MILKERLKDFLEKKESPRMTNYSTKQSILEVIVIENGGPEGI
jgi:hypothetical protein